MKKAALIVGMAASSFLLSATSIFAATGGKVPSLAQEIADQFHLDKNQVQGVIDQHKNEVRSQMDQNYENRLQQAVNAGTITNDQKTQIEAKHKEFTDLVDSLRGQRNKTAFDQIRSKTDELRQWADDNKIPTNLVIGRARLGTGRGFGPGPAPSVSPSPSPNASTQSMINPQT